MIKFECIHCEQLYPIDQFTMCNSGRSVVCNDCKAMQEREELYNRTGKYQISRDLKRSIAEETIKKYQQQFDIIEKAGYNVGKFGGYVEDLKG